MRQAARLLSKLDDRIARAELTVSAGLLAASFAILLAGAGMRSLGRPLLWADEGAVLLMACSGFLGASAALARGRHVTVSILQERLPRVAGDRVQRLVQGLLCLGLAGFAWLLWIWFDPVGLIRHGSAQALAQETFNFIYQEPTVTLGIPKFWGWLVLVPFCAGSLLHALAGVLAGPGRRVASGGGLGRDGDAAPGGALGQDGLT